MGQATVSIQKVAAEPVHLFRYPVDSEELAFGPKRRLAPHVSVRHAQLSQANHVGNMIGFVIQKGQPVNGGRGASTT
jgi:hypothetical protein